MKKIIVGLIALLAMVSCVEDEDVIIKNEHEKTKLNQPAHQKGETIKKGSDSIQSITPPPRTAGATNPIEGLEPGEVGPVVTTPPK